MKKMIISAIAVALLSACAGPEFSLYSGPQQNWPTQQGSFVNMATGMPIYYRSYPNRPYIVLGIVEADATRISGLIIAQKARALGADAMIFSDESFAGTLTTGSGFTSGNIYPGGFNANTTGVRRSTVITKGIFTAIKWR